MLEKITNEMLQSFDSRAEAMKAKILNSESCYPSGVPTFYVSADGNDENDGSQQHPWKTVAKVSAFDFPENSVVLFRRGDLFRGPLKGHDFVTYSAYGKGYKPVICASISAAGKGDWLETEHPNIYRYKEKLHMFSDIGNIVFDGGKAWGIKVLKCGDGVTCVPMGTVSNGLETFERPREAFLDESNLKHNLEYYHNYESQDFFLYWDKGNPADSFSSIEMARRVTAIDSEKPTHIVVDNIAIKHAGVHGIGCSECDGFILRNCEIAWIGGSVQVPERPVGPDQYPVRLGNGIEAWSGAKDYRVENCYFHQIYDCCITAQFAGECFGKDHIFKNIEFKDNLCEYSNTGLEMWLNQQEKFSDVTCGMENINLHGNICRHFGKGWSHQRPGKDANMFYSDPFPSISYFKNVFIQDNIFYGSKVFLVFARYVNNRDGLGYHFKNNTFVHGENQKLGILPTNPEDCTGEIEKYDYTEENIERFCNAGTFDNCRFYIG